MTLRLDFSEKVTRQTYALAIFICAKLSEMFSTPLNFWKLVKCHESTNEHRQTKRHQERGRKGNAEKI